MASLKCSNCGNGIHYHDEADGTQYIVFFEMDWKNLVKSDLRVSRYILDGNVEYYIAWKCSKCGTIHIFKYDSTTVISAYKRVELKYNNNITEGNYIAFSDEDWDIITETQILGKDITEMYPDCKRISICYDDGRFVVKHSDGSIDAYYEAISR